MQITFEELDLVACDTKGVAAVATIQRQSSERWLVPLNGVRDDQPIQWSPTLRGDYVSIPLVPYIVRPETHLALSFVFQLGMQAANDLGRPIKRLHMAIGCPVHEAEHEGKDVWRFLLGFGVVLE